MSLLKLVSRCAYHIISRQRPPDPLQLELADRLNRHGVLDLCQHPRTDEDLPRLGFVAEPRRDVGYGPYSGLVEAPLEADGAERSEGNAQFSINRRIAHPASGCARN